MSNNEIEVSSDMLLSGAEISVSTVFDRTIVAAAKLPSGFVIVEYFTALDEDSFDEQEIADICLAKIKMKLLDYEHYTLMLLNGGTNNESETSDVHAEP